MKYSQTSFTDTKGTEPIVRFTGVRIIEVAEESMIFGISWTKRTVRYRGVRKERLDCTRFFANTIYIFSFLSIWNWEWTLFVFFIPIPYSSKKAT